MPVSLYSLAGIARRLGHDLLEHDLHGYDTRATWLL